jgi:hypothetical protein
MRSLTHHTLAVLGHIAFDLSRALGTNNNAYHESNPCTLSCALRGCARICWRVLVLQSLRCSDQFISTFDHFLKFDPPPPLFLMHLDDRHVLRRLAIGARLVSHHDASCASL